MGVTAIGEANADLNAMAATFAKLTIMKLIGRFQI